MNGTDVSVLSVRAPPNPCALCIEPEHLRQNPSDGPEFDYRQAVGFHLAFDVMTLGIASFLAARFTRGAISLVTQKVG